MKSLFLLTLLSSLFLSPTCLGKEGFLADRINELEKELRSKPASNQVKKIDSSYYNSVVRKIESSVKDSDKTKDNLVLLDGQKVMLKIDSKGLLISLDFLNQTPGDDSIEVISDLINSSRPFPEFSDEMKLNTDLVEVVFTFSTGLPSLFVNNNNGLKK